MAAEKRARVFAEGQKAISEYEATAVNVRKNMARLRDLRLAKEAADRAANIVTEKPPKKASKKSSAKT